jgi:hypothetical protein
MDELTTRTAQLPDTLEDLSQFVLVNKAKLDAYRLKLRTINRLSDAQEIREQTLQEMQDISSALIAAETRIGEILLSIPKASGQYAESENRPISKNTVVTKMGYSKDQASDYQRMAQNQSVVNLVLEQAEREGRVVSHAEVMKQIKAKDAEIKRLHDDNKILARRANPEVVEKVVEVEVVPDDYEELKRKNQTYEADNKRLNREYKQVTSELADAKRQLKESKSPSADDKVVQSAQESMDNFSIATYDFIRRYGGNVWSFDKWADVPDSTRTNFAKAIQALSAFAQQMADNIAGIE